MCPHDRISSGCDSEDFYYEQEFDNMKIFAVQPKKYIGVLQNADTSTSSSVLMSYKCATQPQLIVAL